MALERIGLGALLEFATGDAVREMERADAAREKLGQGFERLGAGVDRISSGLRQTLGAVAQVGAAAAAAGAGAVQRFATFETSLAKIGTLLDDGAAGAQKYGPAIERMSVQFGQSAAVVSEGVFQAISASVKAEEAIGFMEEAQTGATAGMTDAVVAVDALTTAINAYGDKLFVQGTAAQKAKALNDAIFVANKLGKCVVGSTRVLLADGSYVAIEDLRDGADVIAWNGVAFEPAKARWWDQGEKECIEVRTRDGRRIITTPEHPYLTPDGWKRVEELNVGDVVAVTNDLPVFGDVDPGSDRAELLGYLLGDGCLTQSTPKLVHGADEYGMRAARRVGELVRAAFGMDAIAGKSNDRAPFLVLSAGRRGHNGANPLIDWLREIDTFGKDARSKSIPAAVFTWTRQSIALLLRGLFTTDGWIAQSTRPDGTPYTSIGYSTASERLARDVVHLLARFGLPSRVRRRMVNDFEQWSIEIIRARAVARFLDEIGVDKGDDSRRAFWAYYETAYRPSGRGRGKPLARIDGAIRFERIVEKRDAGRHRVYDLTVPGWHNFVAEDFVAHNTTYDEIAKSIGLVASTAAGANVDFRELTSAIAAMTSAGIQTNQSVTAINQAILAFTNPTQEAKKKAAELGIEFNANTLRTMGFAKALEYVKTATGGNEEALGALFGSVEAGRAVAVLAGTGMQNFKTALETTKTTVGITDRAFADMSNTLTFRFKQATQAADTGARRIGRAIVEELGLGSANAVPIIEQAFERMEGAVRRFIQLARQGFEQLRIRERLEAIGGAIGAVRERIEAAFGNDAGERIASIATALGVMAAAAVPVAAVLSPLIGIVTGLASAAMGLVSALGGVGAIAAGVGEAVAFMGANMLSLTGVGAAVAVVFQAFIDNASGVRDAFLGMFESLWNVVTTVGQVVMDLFSALQPTLQAVADVVGAVLAPVFNILGGIFDRIAPALKMLGQLFGEVFQVVGTLAGFLRDILVPVFDVLGEALSRIAGFITNVVVAAFEAVIETVRTMVGWIKDAIDWVAELLGAAEETSEAAQRLEGNGVGSNVVSDARATIVQKVQAEIATKERAAAASNAVAAAPAAQVNATASAVAKEARKNKIEIANTMKVDGRSMNVATSRAQLELTERAGSNVTPWQRRQIIERGAVAVGA